MVRISRFDGRQLLGACALAAWVCAAGAADIPEPVKKLTGSSDESARTVMAQQGFALRSQKSSWGRDYAYWWNGKSRQCVQLMSLAGRVAQVQAKGESDCQPGAAGGPAAASAPGAALDRLSLPGQPRSAAEQRLLGAGFKAVETNMSQGDSVVTSWTDGQRCWSVVMVAERVERVDEMSRKGCYLK